MAPRDAGAALDAAGIAWIVGGSVRRRQFLRVGETAELPVLSPEDVILQKLRWYDAGQRISERQWRDVLGVLKVRAGTLDEGYLRAQAHTAGFGDLLEQALGDAKT
jgi:hypothetical protein